ncbi:MAG: hypothetical protein KDB74_12900, partial [Flavobacteriales bacterium]|nr:hypothetical protein [Flavobacteriales bacterium]
MRIILIVIGFILVNCFAQGQTTFLKDQQFVPIGGKFYGGNGVNQLSDSSYMVIGVEKTGLESSACFMAKYKPNGELAKVRHSLTDSPFFYVDFKSVTFLPDESFWTCATYYTSGFDTTQMANFHYDSEGNLLGSITQDGGYSRIIQINDSIMAGIFVYDSTDTNIYNPNKELHLLRFDGSLVLNTKIRGEDIYFNGQNLFLERRENDSLKWFRKIDLDSFNFLDSFSVVIDSVFGRFQFTKNEFIYIYYNYYYPDKTYFFGRNLNDYSKIWSGKNGYIEGEEFTTFDFSFNYSTYYNDSVYLRVALTKDGKGKTVIGKLKPNGLIELLNVNYRYTATQFTFYPKFKTLDNGFFGLASDHFSPSSNFKLMKTDSFGQVLNS